MSGRGLLLVLECGQLPSRLLDRVLWEGMRKGVVLLRRSEGAADQGKRFSWCRPMVMKLAWRLEKNPKL